MLLQKSWEENGVTWHEAYSTKGDYLGYVHEKGMYIPGEYVFCIGKENGEYKLLGVPRCPATDESFEYEVSIRKKEISEFNEKYRNEYYEVGDKSIACEAVREAIDDEMPKLISSYADNKYGFKRGRYSINLQVLAYDKDSIKVVNYGDITCPISIVENAVNSCYDNGSLKKKSEIFKKYNYEALIPGRCYYSNIFDVYPIEMTLSLKKGEWTADKKYLDLYSDHFHVCEQLVKKVLANNPKQKKVSISILCFDSSNTKYYYTIAGKFKHDKIDRYVIGEQVEF